MTRIIRTSLKALIFGAFRLVVLARLGPLGWIVAIIMASAAMFCWLGLGYSVSLRKKGKSVLSFTVQFAGIIGIGLTIILYYIFTGNLLRYLN